MNQDTLLHRQVHPNFIRNGETTSQAFTPTPKDNNRLSVYDGDMISATVAWEHFTGVLGFKSGGVMSVSVAECQAIELSVSSDPADFPEHALIEFDGFARRQATTRAKQLREYANARGWLFRLEA